MRLRSGTIKPGDGFASRRMDKPRVTKRKASAPRTPLAAAEQSLISKKFRWTEKRDRTLLIHLIGLGGAITDEECAKLATLWEGATADDVHARVEFLRAQQILTIRTEETAEAAAEAYPESARADNVDRHANVEESVSEETSSPHSPSPSLDHGALTPPSPPSPSHPSSSSAISNDEGDDADNNDDDETRAALKPALKSRGSTTAVSGGKSVHFASPVIATVRAIPRLSENSVRDHKRGRRWFPVATAPWEDEMFSAEDASDSASTSSSSSRRRRKRAAADDDDDDDNDDDDLARPAKRRRSTSGISNSDDDDDNDDDDDDNDNVEEEETEVSYPLSQTARSPRVPRTRAGSSLTASNFFHEQPTKKARGFRNHLGAWPKPVRAMAAVAEGLEWQEESDDEGETAVIARDDRFQMRDEIFPRLEFASGRRLPAATVEPDLGWEEPAARDSGGLWELEGEDESEEEGHPVESGDVDDMVVEEAEGLVGGSEDVFFQPAQPIYDHAQGPWGYQQAEGGVSAPYYGEQFAGDEYGNSAGGWSLSEASQEEPVDDGSAGQQYFYPPPPVDDGGNTPYPILGSASPAWMVGEDEVAERPQQQQHVEETEEEEERDADDDDDWSYFNQFSDQSIRPNNP
ncbi:uncharacterized protein BKCO1_1030003 [Diplodia corticola]|uniref:Uncharacterized protein n=1 Tax=Diplodia corticola TaxID=236234 RepID=A0A1J9RK72_9PEZI|nr:uncharacterized protein BKCO1_1030003 [Diplodia corticola]OJD28919.1 hypothetical protein BKCO1_1030003 [Diplodia corticola]